MMLSIFWYACWACFLWENVCLSSLPIFTLGYFLLSCGISLCILDVNSLAETWVLPFHWESSLFCLCPLQHRSLYFWGSLIWLFFYFAFCACSIMSNKSLPNSMSRSFSHMFSSNSFKCLILMLIFNPSRVNFVCGILLHVLSSFSNTIFWKDCPFHIEWCWHL